MARRLFSIFLAIESFHDSGKGFSRARVCCSTNTSIKPWELMLQNTSVIPITFLSLFSVQISSLVQSQILLIATPRAPQPPYSHKQPTPRIQAFLLHLALFAAVVKVEPLPLPDFNDHARRQPGHRQWVVEVTRNIRENATYNQETCRKV